MSQYEIRSVATSITSGLKEIPQQDMHFNEVYCTIQVHLFKCHQTYTDEKNKDFATEEHVLTASNPVTAFIWFSLMHETTHLHTSQ